MAVNPHKSQFDMKRITDSQLTFWRLKSPTLALLNNQNLRYCLKQGNSTINYVDMEDYVTEYFEYLTDPENNAEYRKNEGLPVDDPMTQEDFTFEEYMMEIEEDQMAVAEMFRNPCC